MPDLLLELRSEEIPARMQRKAAGDLRKMVTDGLVEAGLTYEGCQEYWTPRRLVLDLRGLTARSSDVHEEIKGPSTKAPEQAIQGFLRKAGLTSVTEAHVHSDPKKGDFYVAHISRPGRAAEDIIAELVPQVIRGFPWPKSMRWGPSSGPKGMSFDGRPGLGGETLRWVRPLQSIVCTFGPETSEPVVVDFEVGGIRSGNVTWGHRFHAPDAITVRRFEDYAAKLEAAKVIVDAERRKKIILADAQNLAFANGLDLVEDEGLLEEVSGLVEWPVVLMGAFEDDYLAIPPEVIRLTIRANQKCFVCAPLSPLAGEMSAQPTEGVASEGTANRSRTAATTPTAASGGTSPARGEGLSNRFLLTANIEASDGGAEIVHGNGKVVRARLSDALYFWKTDQSDLPDLDQLKPSAEKFGLDLTKPLDQRMARLDHLGVTFHAKLGTQGERVERIARLAEEIARQISPLAGEMSAKPTEGVPSEGTATTPRTAATTEGVPSEGTATTPRTAATTEGVPSEGTATTPRTAAPTPSAASGGTSPARGEGIASLARRAAILAKADLTTEIVGEFPELQGAMGRKYALLQDEHPSVAAAIEEHYKPQGPTDSVPADPVSIAVALADKLDTLVGFWAIDEKPTGSKDPFALRRAALGVIRILVENGVRLGLITTLVHAWALHIQRSIILDEEEIIWPHQEAEIGNGFYLPVVDARYQLQPPSFLEVAVKIRQRAFLSADREVAFLGALAETVDIDEDVIGLILEGRGFENDLPKVVSDVVFGHDRLLSFFHDRLKVYLRDKGARHDLFDAVLASRPISPLVGEMSAQPTEGGAVPPASRSVTPPSALPGISPTRGEIGQSQVAGTEEERFVPQPPIPYDVDHLHGTQTPSALPGISPSRGEIGQPPTANDDLLTIVRRVEALGALLDTDEGKNLLAGAKRAANILAAEEKKGTRIAAAVAPALFAEPAERHLYEAVNRSESEAAQAIQREDFSAAMRALAALREPVDSFFEAVLVNDEDLAVRANRLALLARIRAATGQVADFSKIAG